MVIAIVKHACNVPIRTPSPRSPATRGIHQIAPSSVHTWELPRWHTTTGSSCSVKCWAEEINLIRLFLLFDGPALLCSPASVQPQLWERNFLYCPPRFVAHSLLSGITVLSTMVAFLPKNTDRCQFIYCGSYKTENAEPPSVEIQFINCFCVGFGTFAQKHCPTKILCSRTGEQAHHDSLKGS